MSVAPDLCAVEKLADAKFLTHEPNGRCWHSLIPKQDMRLDIYVDIATKLVIRLADGMFFCWRMLHGKLC